MSVLVKGMKMPKNCEECRVAYDLNKDEYGNYDCICVVTNELIAFDGSTGRKVCGDPCPIVEVPPHGRLIDADALKAWFVEWYDLNADLEIIHFLEILSDEDSAPTIIEAEV